MENVEFGRGVPMGGGCPWKLTQGMLLFSRAFGGQDKPPHRTTDFTRGCIFRKGSTICRRALSGCKGLCKSTLGRIEWQDVKGSTKNRLAEAIFCIRVHGMTVCPVHRAGERPSLLPREARIHDS